MRFPSHGHRGLVGVPLLATMCLLLAMLIPSIAEAGTYTMNQCSHGAESVAEGWSVFTGTTLASAELQDHCSEGEPLLGAYVFSEGHPGWVTEASNGGSTVGLTLKVPSSAPGVTIKTFSARLMVSPVYGDDVFIGFTADGSALAGGSVLGNGGGEYDTTREWALPEGSHEWGMRIYCSTDASSPTCAFSLPDRVPAVSEVSMTLQDDTPPELAGATGGLAEAAVAHATVKGTQSLTIEAKDAGAGVHAVKLTLTPEAEAEPVVREDSLTEQCVEDSWHACPTSTTATFPVNTTNLEEGVYQVAVSAIDAAGNTQTKQLGSIRVAHTSTLEEAPGPMVLVPTPAPAPRPAPAPSPSSVSTTALPACKIILGEPAHSGDPHHHRQHRNPSPHHERAHHRKHPRPQHVRKHGLVVTRSWQHAALKLAGIVEGGTGVPTVGLPVTLSETRGLPTAQGGHHTVARTISTTNGQWTLRAPASGNRRLQVQCGKSTMTVVEHVQPILSLHAASQPGGVLQFTGRFAGPHQPVRSSVMVQVHGPHGWQEVGNPVHPHHHHWQLTYHTSPRLAGYKFEFRAVSPSTPWAMRATSPRRELRIR